MIVVVAIAMVVGLALGGWQGYEVGVIRGESREHRSVCAFLLALASSKDAQTHTPRELSERIGTLEHREWHISGDFES